MFEIHKIDSSRRAADEQLGTKSKFWFFGEENRRFLFKAEERGTGEDWAEKIVCELCKLLSLPHVHYDLAAEYDGGRFISPGVICETCAPPPTSLVLGNELLFALDSSYPRHDHRRYKVRSHTISAVADMVCRLYPPPLHFAPGLPLGIENALDVFAGYAMLDAWVANQDRHHENWGALSHEHLELAPTFDHGAALARNLTDEERLSRMNTKDMGWHIETFARKARSAFYSGVPGSKALITDEAFWEFAGLARPAANAWLERLASIDEAAVQGIIDQIPAERMTEPARAFTLQLLSINQRRLLAESSRL